MKTYSLVKRALRLAVLGLATLPLPALGASLRCSLPIDSDDPFEKRTAEQVKLDPAIVDQALLYATTHGRVSVQIFRHNCRVASAITDVATSNIPNNVWSCTKSVIGLLTGLAASQGKLTLDDPIGKHLPTGLGWGDAAHRAITIRQLMTETSGLLQAIIAEAATVIIDPNAPMQALAQPLIHKPGSTFEYGQRVMDLLAFVVQRAVGQDIQDYAQTMLFSPIGIDRKDYFWLRDRSGNSYGYAWLFLPPEKLARLGLLVLNGGAWNKKQIVPRDFVTLVAQSSEKNPCYGKTFWTNSNAPCTGASIPTQSTVNRRLTPAAPPDMFAMVGALQQNNFIIPSLDMTVTWTGLFGDSELQNPSVFLSATPGDLYNNFFRILMSAVKDKKPNYNPGPLNDTTNLNVDITDFISPTVLLNDIFPNSECNIVYCNKQVPLEGLFKNVGAVGDNVLGSTGRGRRR